MNPTGPRGPGGCARRSGRSQTCLDKCQMKRSTTGGPGSATAGGTGLGQAGKPAAKKAGARPSAASRPAVEMVDTLDHADAQVAADDLAIQSEMERKALDWPPAAKGRVTNSRDPNLNRVGHRHRVSARAVLQALEKCRSIDWIRCGCFFRRCSQTAKP